MRNSERGQRDAFHRLSRWLLCAVATLVFGVLAASPAAAITPSSVRVPAAINALTRTLFQSPSVGGLVTRLPVRVAVRVPARTARLRVELAGHDVSSRFHASGNVWVAKLTRGDGVRQGSNELFALAQRTTGRPEAQARAFVFARRSRARLTLRVSDLASMTLDLDGGPGIAPRLFRGRAAFTRRLAGIEADRHYTVWLNGRRVTAAVSDPRLTQLTATLSASQGLHYGVNLLRVRVIEPGKGRYVTVQRRFMVRRDRPLAAAGADRSARVGERLRLDGDHSLPETRGAALSYRWSLVKRPVGSRVALRAAAGPTPVLDADLPGTYVARLTVSQGGRSSADDVTVTASPGSPLLPFRGYTVDGGQHPGIQVGGQFYPNPAPGPYAMQWLTLNRATLRPVKTGNSWLDGSDSGPHGLPAITNALSSDDLNQLVIFSFGPIFNAGPPVQPAQVDGFNKALALIGVGPISSGVLTTMGQKLVILGVPYGGAGSGYFTHGGSANPYAMQGWLMPDQTAAVGSSALRYRFAPERLAFDTASRSTPTTNTMTIGATSADGSLSAGATGGFEVAIVDPIDFAIVNQQTFSTSGVADPDGALASMAAFLKANAGLHYDVAVQSIGHVTGDSPAWGTVATELSAYGANPDTFNRVDGAYAFLGGAPLTHAQDADSSSTIVLDPDATPPKHETGTLVGVGTMRNDGYILPVLDPAATAFRSFDSSLYNIVFHAPTPWPYTTGPDAPAYAKAMADITSGLPDLRQWYPDLRQAYLANDNLSYSDSKTDLSLMRYSGDGQTCEQGAGPITSNPGYTRAQFCTLSDELQHEFDWLDATKTLFDAYQKALSRSGNQQQVDLQTIGEDIRSAIAPPDDSLVSQALGFVVNILKVGAGLAGPEAAAGVGAFASAYQLASSLASDSSGAPVGDQIQTKVNQLASQLATNLSSSANALDRIRDVAISDYGRLKALAQLASGPAGIVNVGTTTRSLTTAARGYFATQLIPIHYNPPAYLQPWTVKDPTPDNCGYQFARGAPPSSQVRFAVGVQGPASRDTQLWILVGDGNRGDFPPVKLTDEMFRPVTQNGLGIGAASFFWQLRPPIANKCYGYGSGRQMAR